MTLRTAYHQLLQKSAFRKRGPETAPVNLNSHRVFILPTRQGLLFSVVLLLILTGSVNYDLNMGYALTFLLAGLGLISILQTHRNLANLCISWGKTQPVFSGQHAEFPIILENLGRYARYSIGVQIIGGEAVFHDVATKTSTTAIVSSIAQQRGLLTCPRLHIFTRFPLGLFRAWSTIEPDFKCLIYPLPETKLTPYHSISGGMNGSSNQGEGNDDFSTLRNYRYGDPATHVAWKALAREQGLLTKQFTGQESAELWFDWDSIPGMETEARLSRLCRWVINADQTGATYGLKLPGWSIPPSNGINHRAICLKSLALFGIRPTIKTAP
ncbi:DUF58 domain-containing protein [Sulfurirhabdus autotrophica]|uniref:Uncharacterized protein (DUF58 family) n=1 Tax=Sulfurirhabdus autotrophica TaxID=1706046 RepID=A0A4R3YF01_9PROT|nr:DUF58 domain-containing protein [Sulfurirhabdus autotrophica]TCV90670.1 uncharacterized protein (DUF58 family) [Sulfurirhabdus autotrophica]